MADRDKVIAELFTKTVHCDDETTLESIRGYFLDFGKHVWNSALGAAAPSLPSAEELARKIWEQSSGSRHRVIRWEDFRPTEHGQEYLSWAKAALVALSGDKVSQEETR